MTNSILTSHFQYRQEKSKALANSSVEAWKITEFPYLSTENGFELLCHYYVALMVECNLFEKTYIHKEQNENYWIYNLIRAVFFKI